MKKENWISRIQEAETTPPADSWEKIQSKRKLKVKQQWSAAVVAGAIALGAISWLNTSTQNSTQDILSEKSITADQKVKSPAEVAQPIESNPISSSSEQSIPTATNENIESTSERSISIAESNLSGFPYNGKVSTTSESRPHVSNQSSEVSNEMGSSDIPENNQVNNEELESASEEIPATFHIDWSTVPNLFTPNNDGQNDVFSPFEGMPDWTGKSWRISFDGNIIQTLNADEKWNGNNAAGFEMPVGQYVVEAFYVDKPQSIQILKRMMVVKLVR
jgi:hypothetical protein